MHLGNEHPCDLTNFLRGRRQSSDAVLKCSIVLRSDGKAGDDTAVILGHFFQFIRSVQFVVERFYADPQFFSSFLFVAVAIERCVNRQHFKVS